MATETRPVPVSDLVGEQLALTTTLAALGVPPKRDTVQVRGVLLKSTADFRLHINPAIKALFKTADSGASYTDYTDEVTDRDTSTSASLNSLDTAANGDYLLVCTDRLIGGLALDLGNMNGNPSVLSGQYWKNTGAWANLAGFADGTISPAGTCLGQDGNVTWTVPTDALQATINGVTGYWWLLKVSAQLDAAVTIREAAALNKDANRGYCYAGMVYPIALGSEAGAIEALVAAGTGTLDVVWCYGDVLQALGSQQVAATIANGADVALGSTTDAAASAVADEDATARTVVGLLKGSKNLLIDVEGLLNGGLPAALAAGGGLKVEGVAGGIAQPVSVANGSDAALGTTTDAPSVATEDGTARTVITLLKGIKNSIYVSLLGILGATNGAAVVTDADGTIQQYLRGLVKLLVDKITVTADQGAAGAAAWPVKPLAAIKELGLVELIDKDDTEVSANDYSKSVAIALGATMSGEITSVVLTATELGAGAVLANPGWLVFFDADPTISAGDTAITGDERKTELGKVYISAADYQSDANGASAFKPCSIPFHEVATLYACFFNLGAAVNDAAGDDEELHLNGWLRRES